jgi:hypothetical protein
MAELGRTAQPPSTVLHMTTDELMAIACPIIRDTGWAFYFTPATRERGAALGLDPLQTYVVGRGGVLGDVEASVVASAFGYFNPAFLAGVWTAGTAACAPRAAGRMFWEASAEHGRARLAEVPGLAEFVAAADAVNAAADPDGLALYAATAAEPLADDLPGRAMQLVTVLREYRGSAHLAAIRAVGLDSKTAHFVKRPNDVKMFGWTEADAPTITDATHQAMDEAEVITDRIVRSAYAVLDDAGAQALVDGLHAIQAAL